MTIESIVEHWVEAIIGAIFSIAMGIWVLSWWIDFDPILDFIKGLFGKERVVIRCPKCGHKNPEKAKHCSECGEEL